MFVEIRTRYGRCFAFDIYTYRVRDWKFAIFNAYDATMKSRVRASKARVPAKQRIATCLPITITWIPVILHTRIIGCHLCLPFPPPPPPPRLPVAVMVPRRLHSQLRVGSHAPSRNRRISLRLASYQKFICLPTNSSKSIDSSFEAPSRASKRFTYLPAVYLELLLMLLLSICLAAGWPPKRIVREIVISPLS